MTVVHKRKSWLFRTIANLRFKFRRLKILFKTQPYQELDKSVVEVKRLQSEAGQRIRAICLMAKSVNMF